MLLRAMLVDAEHAALEDREVAFNRVGCDLATAATLANVLLGGVVDRFVFGELAARPDVGGVFVGMQDALARGVRDQNRAQCVGGKVFDLDGASAPAALH